MAVDETGEEQTKTTSQPVKKISVPPTAQALSSTQIEAAPEGHPAFQMMPRGWGEGLRQTEARV